MNQVKRNSIYFALKLIGTLLLFPWWDWMFSNGYIYTFEGCYFLAGLLTSVVIGMVLWPIVNQVEYVTNAAGEKKEDMQPATNYSSFMILEGGPDGIYGHSRYLVVEHVEKGYEPSEIGVVYYSDTLKEYNFYPSNEAYPLSALFMQEMHSFLTQLPKFKTIENEAAHL